MSSEDDYSYAAEEFAISYSELMEMTTHQVLINFYQRHDELIDEVTEDSREQKACAEGCGYCCHLKVIADAVEIFALVDYAKKLLSKDQLEKIESTANKNIKQAQHLTHQQQATINQQCPLLQNNRCMIYPVRPIKCRNYHSTDKNNCRNSFENPKDLTILNNNIPDLYIAATGSTHGFYTALHQQGYDDRIYDHNAAFIEALHDEECKKRYDKGERAFRHAKYNNE